MARQENSNKTDNFHSADNKMVNVIMRRFAPQKSQRIFESRSDF